MQKVEVNLPPQLIKRAQKHVSESTTLDVLVRRALELYVSRLGEIEAAAEHAKIYGYWPSNVTRPDPDWQRPLPY